MRVVLNEFLKSQNALIVLRWVSQVLNNFLELVLNHHFGALGLLWGCLLYRTSGVVQLQALYNNLDPLFNMVVWAWVVLNHGVALHD